MVLQCQPVGTEVSTYCYCSVSKLIRKPLHNRKVELLSFMSERDAFYILSLANYVLFAKEYQLYAKINNVLRVNIQRVAFTYPLYRIISLNNVLGWQHGNVRNCC